MLMMYKILKGLDACFDHKSDGMRIIIARVGSFIKHFGSLVNQLQT